MVNPNTESKDEIVLVHSIIRARMKVRKRLGDRKKKKKTYFNQVREYVRMRRMSNERLL